MHGNAEEVKNRMDRMLSMQSQKMDCLGARLEAEAKRTNDIMKNIEEKLNEQKRPRISIP